MGLEIWLLDHGKADIAMNELEVSDHGYYDGDNDRENSMRDEFVVRNGWTYLFVLVSEWIAALADLYRFKNTTITELQIIQSVNE